MGKYVEWKASLPLVALDVWWTMIVISWLRPMREVVLGKSHAGIFLIVGAIVVLHSSLMGSKEVQENYRQEFLKWPRKRRRICDWLVAAFHGATIALLILSAFESKRFLYPS